jgi:hypothetical protein
MVGRHCFRPIFLFWQLSRPKTRCIPQAHAALESNTGFRLISGLENAGADATDRGAMLAVRAEAAGRP